MASSDHDSEDLQLEQVEEATLIWDRPGFITSGCGSLVWTCPRCASRNDRTHSSRPRFARLSDRRVGLFQKPEIGVRRFRFQPWLYCCLPLSAVGGFSRACY